MKELKMGITGTWARTDHSIPQKVWQEFEYLTLLRQLVMHILNLTGFS
jgi:hypothetical protein